MISCFLEYPVEPFDHAPKVDKKLRTWTPLIIVALKPVPPVVQSHFIQLIVKDGPRAADADQIDHIVDLPVSIRPNGVTTTESVLSTEVRRHEFASC